VKPSVIAIKKRIASVLALSLLLQFFAFTVPETAQAVAQNAYRWRNDDGTEVSASNAASENAALTGLEKNDARRLRMAVGADGATMAVASNTEKFLGGMTYPLFSKIATSGATNYAYLVGFNGDIMKVRLDAGNPTVVAKIEDPGADYRDDLVLDETNGFAYIGRSSGVIEKYDMGVGDAVPTLVATTPDIIPGNAFFYSAVIDVANGYAYFGTDASPGVVYKVDVDPNRTFEIVGSVTFAAGENYLESAVIDNVNHFAYFGTATSPGKVIKVDVDPLNTFAKIGTVTLSVGENDIHAGVIDVANGYAYFGQYGGTGNHIFRIDINPANTFARVGTVTLPAGETDIRSGVIDVANGYALFGTAFGGIVKVDVDPGRTFQRVSALAWADTWHYYSDDWVTAMFDTETGYAYFPTYNNASDFLKIDPGAGASAPSKVGEENLFEEYGLDMLVDSANGYGYVMTGDSSTADRFTRVVKYQLGSGDAAPTRIGHLTFGLLIGGMDGDKSSVIDAAQGFAYVGTYAGESIVKVDLGSGSAVPTLVSVISPGLGPISTAAIDTSGGYAYFGTDTSPAQVLKIRLSDFTHVGTLNLAAGDNSLGSAAIDATNGHLYFGTRSNPAEVVKVRLSDFTQLTTLTLTGIDGALRSTLAIDAVGGYGYLTAQWTLDKLVKFALGAGNAAPTLVGSMTANDSVIRDPSTGNLFVGTLNKYDPGIGSAMPTLSESLMHTFDDEAYPVVVGDFTNRYIYTPAYVVGTDFYQSLVKININPSSSLSLRLEYAKNDVGDCAAIASWTQVAATPTTEHWAMAASANITNGAATTDSTSLTNLNATFVAGSIHDTTSQTSPIDIDVGKSTEVEFSIQATDDANDGQPYCFRLTNAGSPSLTYTNYAQATTAGRYTTTNAVILSRLKVSTSADVTVSFALLSTMSGTLTVTFPSTFTVTSDPTSGASSGCLSGFGHTTTTIYATKTACSGVITLGGATVTNPATAGQYQIDWVNDQPGSTQVAIVDDDQVTVSVGIDPILNFNVGVQPAATACDGTFSGNGGTVTLSDGPINTTSVATSDVATVKHICTRVSSNALGGAIVTVRNENGADGLVSEGTPTDTIPVASGALTAGTAGYGICVGSGGSDTGNDVYTGTSSPVREAPFDGTCSTSSHVVGDLSDTPQPILSLDGPAQNAFARIFVKSAFALTTVPHDDYADTLTFVATATF